MNSPCRKFRTTTITLSLRSAMMTPARPSPSTAGALQSYKDLAAAEHNSSFSLFEIFEKLERTLPGMMLIPLCFIMALGMIVLIPVVFAVNSIDVFGWSQNSSRYHRGDRKFVRCVIVATQAAFRVREAKNGRLARGSCRYG